MKRVLMLNASHNDWRAIKALKELGYYVITTGNRPNLSGHKLADEYICEDYSDKEKILKLAGRLKLDAICASCNDFGVLTAAYVAEKLDLPGHDTYENAQILHHKDRFKDFAREHGIRTPLAESFDDVDAATEWVKNAKYPI
ncbi:MAG: carboxylate--amine ligase, partial [Desulfosporosinus sp.]